MNPLLVVLELSSPPSVSPPASLSTISVILAVSTAAGIGATTAAPNENPVEIEFVEGVEPNPNDGATLGEIVEEPKPKPVVDVDPGKLPKAPIAPPLDKPAPKEKVGDPPDFELIAKGFTGGGVEKVLIGVVDLIGVAVEAKGLEIVGVDEEGRAPPKENKVGAFVEAAVVVLAEPKLNGLLATTGATATGVIIAGDVDSG